MAEIDTAFSHHFLQIAQAQIVGKERSHTKQDYWLIEMTTREHHIIPACLKPDHTSATIDGKFATVPLFVAFHNLVKRTSIVASELMTQVFQILHSIDIVERCIQCVRELRVFKESTRSALAGLRQTL